MTSVLNVDTIADKAGTGPVGLTKQSAAKATIAAGIDASLFDSFNISSGEDEGTGDYKYNVTSAFSGTTVEKCCSACTLGTTAVVRTKAADATASVIDIEVMNSSFNEHDGNHALAVHGDLA